MSGETRKRCRKNSQVPISATRMQTIAQQMLPPGFKITEAAVNALRDAVAEFLGEVFVEGGDLLGFRTEHTASVHPVLQLRDLRRAVATVTRNTPLQHEFAEIRDTILQEQMCNPYELLDDDENDDESSRE